jgi:hypothetical protein
MPRNLNKIVREFGYCTLQGMNYVELALYSPVVRDAGWYHTLKMLAITGMYLTVCTKCR